MKNLPPISELKERIRRQSERTAWLRADVESYLTAETVQEGLGTWPGKLARTDVEFDPDEARAYGNVPGGKLSGLAARIVLTANDEWRLLKVLRGVAAAMIEPLVAYLRVNLAMTKLEETIDNTCHSGPVFACKHRDPEGREIGDELGFAPTSRPSGPLFASKQKAGMTDKKKPPTFKWSQSPRAAYGFAEAKAAYGFDPRDTSVYWIEKRAARLRRKWARYGKENLPLQPSFESRDCVPPQDEGAGALLDRNGLTSPLNPHDGEQRSCPSKHGKEMQDQRLEPSFESPGCARPQDKGREALKDIDDEPDIPVRHFVPADADYNTIWPPMELPDGPLGYSSTARRGRCRSAAEAEGGEQSEVTMPSCQDGLAIATDQSINTVHDIQAGKPAVMREASPLDETLLDGDGSSVSPHPHAEEQRSCPSKHGKKIQSSGLQPSFESRRFTPPQDEGMGVLPESREFPASPDRKEGGGGEAALYTNRKARRAEAVKQRRGRCRAGTLAVLPDVFAGARDDLSFDALIPD